MAADDEEDEIFDDQEDGDEDIEEGDDLDEPDDEDFDDDDSFLDDDSDDDSDTLLEAPTDVSIRRRSGKKGLVVEGEPKAKLEKPDVAKQVWDRLCKKFEGVPTRKYSVRESFAIDDVIEHSKFGMGFIIEIPGKGKVEVLFEDGLKRLVHEK